MRVTKPIPVRLGAEILGRLDAAAAKIGTTRAGIIRFCTDTWLRHFEESGIASLPPNWREIMENFDGRTNKIPRDQPYPRARRPSPNELNE
jgi:predicted DNA-binding protein